MIKTNYFYIDETGSLGNNSNVFIHGCIKTDTPEILSDGLKRLKNELINELYFEGFIERIEKEGFHAVDNHPDIRAHFYKLLPLLDYRAYFVILNKATHFYQNVKKEKKEFEIFEYSLHKLLKDRILKNKNDKNIFYFEQINIKEKSLKRILDDFFNNLSFSHNCEYHIVSKEVPNLAVIDYLNYIFIQILERNQKESRFDRMRLNFELIKSKIGVINILHNNTFLNRKRNNNQIIEYKNLIKEFGGNLE